LSVPQIVVEYALDPCRQASQILGHPCLVNLLPEEQRVGEPLQLARSAGEG